VALPFGFDGPLWWVMGLGIEWMIAVAVWVASLPGAVGRIAAFGTGPLLLGTVGLLTACLLRMPLRWCGGGFLVAGVVWAIHPQSPDVLVAEGGQAFGVRTADGRLAVVKTGSDTFAIREWLAADGDPRLPTDPGLTSGFSCDPAGRIAPAKCGAPGAVVRAPGAFAEVCARGAPGRSTRP